MKVAIIYCAVTIALLLSGCVPASDPHRLTVAQAFGLTDPWGDAPWHEESPCQWKVQRAEVGSSIENEQDTLVISTSWSGSDQLVSTIKSNNGVDSSDYSRYQGNVIAGPYADRPAVFRAITHAVAADCPVRRQQ
jgi:hypothetical protein